MRESYSDHTDVRGQTNRVSNVDGELVVGVTSFVNDGRLSVLIDVLEDKLEELVDDEKFRRQHGDAYYDDRIGYETVEAILGREEGLCICENRSTGHPLNLVVMSSTMARYLNRRTLIHLIGQATSEQKKSVTQTEQRDRLARTETSRDARRRPPATRR